MNDPRDHDLEPDGREPDGREPDRVAADGADPDGRDPDGRDLDGLGSDGRDEGGDGDGGDDPRRAGGRTTAADAPARRRVSAAGAVIGLLVGLLAFAFVVQVRSNSGDTQLENARQDDLVRILSDLDAREQRLRAEISTEESTLTQLGAGAQGREAALAEAKRRADELGILAGTLPAVGEGLVIRLVPGGTQRIRATTVLAAVEELRGAGAEAMQVSGVSGGPVRVVAQTSFVDGADGVVVDGQTLTGQLAITVIGPAKTMRTALTIPGGVADAVARDGGTVVVDEPGEVKVDALHTTAGLQYAHPVS